MNNTESFQVYNTVIISSSTAAMPPLPMPEVRYNEMTGQYEYDWTLTIQRAISIAATTATGPYYGQSPLTGSGNISWTPPATKKRTRRGRRHRTRVPQEVTA